MIGMQQSMKLSLQEKQWPNVPCLERQGPSKGPIVGEGNPIEQSTRWGKKLKRNCRASYECNRRTSWSSVVLADRALRNPRSCGNFDQEPERSSRHATVHPVSIELPRGNRFLLRTSSGVRDALTLYQLAASALAPDSLSVTCARGIRKQLIANSGIKLATSEDQILEERP